MSLVKVDRVTKRYRLGNREVTALDEVSITVSEGEFLALSGPSGSGKSTLLNLVGCIDMPTVGYIYLQGREVSGLNSDQLADLRARSIGFIFQTFNLLPVLSAWENVEYPMLFRPDLSRSERRDRVAAFLERVGLTRFARHRPNELSGGQRQRVAIARALATGPAIVLADEPTANLDHNTGQSILDLMHQINKNDQTTFVFSTHDPKVTQMADRVVRLTDGKVVKTGYEQAQGEPA